MSQDSDLYENFDEDFRVSSEEISSHECRDDLDLFDELIISKENEKKLQEEKAIKDKFSKLEKELNLLREKCANLEDDNKTLIWNISSLWKTSIAQLRKKDTEIRKLRKENELIIFKRAMRQVSKDELERVVSHIAAYQREEFAEFLQFLQTQTTLQPQAQESSHYYKPKLKKKRDDDILEAVKGSRISEEENLQALHLQRLSTKQGKRNVSSQLPPNALEKQEERDAQGEKLAQTTMQIKAEELYHLNNEENCSRESKKKNLKCKSKDSETKNNILKVKEQEEQMATNLGLQDRLDREEAVLQESPNEFAAGERERKINYCPLKISEVQPNCEDSSIQPILRGLFGTKKKASSTPSPQIESFRSMQTPGQFIGKTSSQIQIEPLENALPLKKHVPKGPQPFNSTKNDPLPSQNNDTVQPSSQPSAKSERATPFGQIGESDNRNFYTSREHNLEKVSFSKESLAEKDGDIAQNTSKKRDSDRMRSDKEVCLARKVTSKDDFKDFVPERKKPMPNDFDIRSWKIPKKASKCKETLVNHDRGSETRSCPEIKKESFLEKQRRRSEGYNHTAEFRDDRRARCRSYSNGMPSRRSTEAQDHRRRRSYWQERRSRGRTRKWSVCGSERMPSRHSERKRRERDRQKRSPTPVRRHSSRRGTKDASCRRYREKRRKENEPEKESVNNTKMISRENLANGFSRRKSHSKDEDRKRIKTKVISKSYEREEGELTDNSSEGEVKIRTLNVREEGEITDDDESSTLWPVETQNEELNRQDIVENNHSVFKNSVQENSSLEITPKAKSKEEQTICKEFYTKPAESEELHQGTNSLTGKLRTDTTSEKVSEKTCSETTLDKNSDLASPNLEKAEKNPLDKKLRRSSSLQPCLVSLVNNLQRTNSFLEKFIEEDTFDGFLFRCGHTNNADSVVLQNEDSEMSLLQYLSTVNGTTKCSPEKSVFSPPSLVLPPIPSPTKPSSSPQRYAAAPSLSTVPSFAFVSSSNAESVSESTKLPQEKEERAKRSSTDEESKCSNTLMTGSPSNQVSLPVPLSVTPTPTTALYQYSLSGFHTQETPSKALSTSICSPISLATPLDAANDVTTTSTPPPLCSTLKSSTPIVPLDFNRKSRFSNHSDMHKETFEKMKSNSPKCRQNEGTTDNGRENVTKSSDLVQENKSKERFDNGLMRDDQNLPPKTDLIPKKENSSNNYASFPELTSRMEREISQTSGQVMFKKRVPFYTLSNKVIKDVSFGENEYKAFGFASSFYQNLDKFEEQWPSCTKYTHSNSRLHPNLAPTTQITASSDSHLNNHSGSSINSNCSTCSSSSSSNSSSSSDSSTCSICSGNDSESGKNRSQVDSSNYPATHLTNSLGSLKPTEMGSLAHSPLKSPAKQQKLIAKSGKKRRIRPTPVIEKTRVDSENFTSPSLISEETQSLARTFQNPSLLTANLPENKQTRRSPRTKLDNGVQTTTQSSEGTPEKNLIEVTKPHLIYSSPVPTEPSSSNLFESIDGHSNSQSTFSRIFGDIENNTKEIDSQPCSNEEKGQCQNQSITQFTLSTSESQVLRPQSETSAFSRNSTIEKMARCVQSPSKCCANKTDSFQPPERLIKRPRKKSSKALTPTSIDYQKERSSEGCSVSPTQFFSIMYQEDQQIQNNEFLTSLKTAPHKPRKTTDTERNSSPPVSSMGDQAPSNLCDTHPKKRKRYENETSLIEKKPTEVDSSPTRNPLQENAASIFDPQQIFKKRIKRRKIHLALSQVKKISAEVT